jgi:hypothetical protein
VDHLLIQSAAVYIAMEPQGRSVLVPLSRPACSPGGLWAGQVEVVGGAGEGFAELGGEAVLITGAVLGQGRADAGLIALADRRPARAETS